MIIGGGTTGRGDAGQWVVDPDGRKVGRLEMTRARVRISEVRLWRVDLNSLIISYSLQCLRIRSTSFSAFTFT
jgi:hypothetical protein